MSDIMKIIIIFAIIIAFAIIVNAAIDFVEYSVHEMLGVPYYPNAR